NPEVLIMSQVLCFGNLQLDVLCRPVTSLPPPGVLTAVEQINMLLSGNGGNVAASLARLGVSVTLAGYRGADVIGDGFAGTLDELGVDISRLPRHPYAATGTSIVALAPNGERTILFTNGANGLFDLDTVPDAWLDGPRVVAVSSVFVLPLFTGGAVARLFARAHANGAKTVLNTSWPSEKEPLAFLRPALAEADYFICSFDEGRELTGHTRPELILEVLESVSRGVVVMTMGADGCIFRVDGHLRQAPAEVVDATDCTGAGDAFVAGFIAGLVDRRPLAGCAALGSRVASYAVTGPGAYPRIPTLCDLDRGVAIRSER
ncbi:MAG: carbohydrate kinase family protein, partial [Chloroflexi bacterium]|nr:carbohydrate kinase family protein [Chloroflexota bacterium]